MSQPLEVHFDGIIYAEQKLGGISRVFTNLMRALANLEGVSVSLYRPGDSQVPCLPENIRQVPYPRAIRLRPRGYFLTFNAWLARKLLERMWGRASKGLFHSTHFTTYPTLRIPQVVTMHDVFHEKLAGFFDEPRRAAFVARKRGCVDSAALIVCDSRSTADGVREHFPGRGFDLRVISLALDPIFLKRPTPEKQEVWRQRMASEAPYLLYVGTRYAYKNFAGLMVAYSKWPKKNQYRLVAIGGGEFDEYELSLVRSLGLEGRIHCVGRISDEELVSAYYEASGVVIPSFDEGFGFALWEAMGCGIPAAAARAGALPEIGMEVPVYFDPADNDGMAAALEEMVSMPKNSARIQEGVRRVHQRTWHTVAQEYLEAYRQAAEGGAN